jgi:hypothetical protein
MIFELIIWAYSIASRVKADVVIKTPLFCSLTLQRSGKFLNLWSADRSFPALRLDVYDIEPQSVFLDDAVDATIATFANGTTGILP